MPPWICALLAAGILISLTGGLLCVAIWLRILDPVLNKFLGFVVLLILGLFLYCILPTCAPPAKTTCECQCEASGGEGEVIGIASAVTGISSANRVITSFFPSRGGYETTLSDDLKIGRKGLELLYYAFHWLVMMYVGLLGLTIFGRHLTDKFRRWTMRCFYGNKMHVFWGDPESARLLAENLRSGKKMWVPKILFLLPGWLKFEHSARTSILRLSDKGYVLDFVDGLPSDDDKYNVVGKEVELEDEDVAGRRHFLLSQNSAYNISLANAIIKKRSVAKGAYAKRKLDLYIRVENSASSSVLMDWADAKMRSVAGKVNIHIFRETEVMAEDFIRRYPILKHWKANGEETDGWLLEGAVGQGVARLRDGVGRLGADGRKGLDVLIVGFGNRGQELLNKMLENSQFIGADDKVIPTRFAILDKCEIGVNGKCCAVGKCPSHEVRYPAYESYARRSPDIAHPPAGSGYSVEFKKIDGDVSEDGFEHFGIKVSEYDRIVVCTGNDELNVQIGDIVRREFIVQGVKLEKGRLFVQLQSENIKGREKVKGVLLNDNVWPIEYFGMWKNIFTYDVVVDENKYYGARLLNWKYCCPVESKLPKDCPLHKTDENGNKTELLCDTVDNEWRKAKWFDKESSIASYRGMLNILALMGYYPDRGDSPKEDAGGMFSEMVVDPESKDWERLAKVEHLRWMAFMRTHGVRSWDLIKPSIEEVDRIGNIAGKTEVKPNVRELIGRHGALADYDDLPSVNMQLAEYNGSCDCSEDCFKGEGLPGRKGYQDNLQWNDMKFVKWIPVLFSVLWEERGKVKRMKIVKIQD